MKKYAAVVSNAPIAKVEELHNQRQQRMFPVVDEKTGRYLGYITYDDVVQYSQQQPSTPVTSEQILLKIIPGDSTRLIHAHPDESLAQAMKKIGAYGLEFLPVVDAMGTYVGTADVESISKLF